MNILIVLKRTKDTAEFNKRHELLLKHVENWSGKDNDVYILTNAKRQNLKTAGVKLVNPPNYLFNDFLISLWFSLVNHPRFDFVIEELSFAPFFYRKSEKVLYISDLINKSNLPIKLDLRGKLISFLVKNFYKKSYILTPSWKIYDLLQKQGIKKQKIFLLQSGLDFGNNKRVKVKVGNTLLFISDTKIDNIKLALQVFKTVERRDLDWKFSILVPSSLFGKAKEIFADNELISYRRIIINKSPKVVLREIARSNILLDLMSDVDSLRNDIVALGLKVPVIAVESDFLKGHDELTKSLILCERSDYFAMAQNVLDFINNEKKYQKKVDSSSDLVKDNTWKSLSEKSLNFLERIRL